jgi:hypothetical protein
MKKNKLQNQFFEELRKVPIVQVAAEKTAISRNSIYRWRKEDPEFCEKMDQAISDGVGFINDMSESQLLTLIKEKDYRSISFWLKHRNDNYKSKIEITAKISEPKKELTPEQKETVTEALKLASLMSEEAKEINSNNIENNEKSNT